MRKPRYLCEPLMGLILLVTQLDTPFLNLDFKYTMHTCNENPKYIKNLLSFVLMCLRFILYYSPQLKQINTTESL